MFFSALSQFTGGKSQNGGLYVTNTRLRMTRTYRQLPHPLRVPLLNKTIVKNLRTLEEQVDL